MSEYGMWGMRELTMSSTDAAGYLFIGSERQRIVAPVQPSVIGEEYETPIVLG